MAEFENPTPPPVPTSAHWARTILWVSLTLILVGGAVWSFKSCVDAPANVIKATSNVLATVAAAFNRGSVSNSFYSYATRITNNLHLQIATLDQMEVFTRQEVPVTAFGYIPLPDVVVEARAPVEYTYYLDLNEHWRFVLRDNQVQVFAPRIRFNKPAVDASQISYEVKKGVLKTDQALDHLKQSISSLVILHARDNLSLVRENARKQTVEFVRNWLMRAFTDGQEYPVAVRFADETSPPNERAEVPRLP